MIGNDTFLPDLVQGQPMNLQLEGFLASLPGHKLQQSAFRGDLANRDRSARGAGRQWHHTRRVALGARRRY